MTPKKRWQRFMVRWRSRQGPWTLWDLDKRDKFLLKRTEWLFKHGFTANRITLLGFLWTIVWIACYDYFHFQNPLLNLLIFIIPIGSSDLFDGSTARNNDDVTPQGTLGDHFRDLLYMLYTGRVALDFGFETSIFLGILTIEVFVLIIKLFDFIWYGGGYTWERLLEFSIDNFQHASEDRWQSILLYFGLPAYIIGANYDLLFMEYAGHALTVLSLGVGFMVIIKEWKWTPTPKDELEKE